MRCKDGVLKAGKNAHNLDLPAHRSFDELCDGSYETLLIQNAAIDRFYEHGLDGKVAQPCLRIRVLMFTPVY